MADAAVGYLVSFWAESQSGSTRVCIAVGSTGPEVLGVTRSDEVNWRDSNNRDRCLVQQDGLPHRCWVTVKTALPRGIAEHRYRFCATVLLFCEHSPAIALTPRTEK